MNKTAKQCKSCEETKPLDEFHSNRNNKDNKSIYCRACVKIKHAKPTKSITNAEKRAEARMRAYGRWAYDHQEWIENFDKEHNIKGRKGGFLPNSCFDPEE